MKRNLLLLSAIFLICLAPRALLLFTITRVNSGNSFALYWDNDSKRYYEEASSLATSNFLPEKSEHLKFLYSWDMPAYRIFLSFFFKIFGESPFVQAIINILAFSFSSCILFLTGKTLFNERVALFSAVIYSFYPSLIIFSILPFTEPLLLLNFLLMSYFFALFLKQGHSEPLIISAVFAGLSSLTKETVIFMPLFMALLIAIKFKRELLKAAKLIYIFLGLYIAILTPCLLYNHNYLGKWTLSLKTDKCVYRFLNNTVIAFKKPELNSKLAYPASGKTEKPNFLAPINDYFQTRKHFFGGTGTISLMRALKENTQEVAVIPADVKSYLNFLKKSGGSWFLYQWLSWIFVAIIYFLSFASLMYLYIKKDTVVANYFLLSVVYFLIIHYWRFNSRYFTLVIPYLCILAAFFTSGRMPPRVKQLSHGKK